MTECNRMHGNRKKTALFTSNFAYLVPVHHGAEKKTDDDDVRDKDTAHERSHRR